MVDRLNISPKVSAVLRHVGIDSSERLLLYSQAELQRLTKLSLGEVEMVQRCASVALYSLASTTALAMRNRCDQKEADFKDSNLKRGRYMKLTTNDAIVDNLLNGGILSKGITEIVGESGSGKTAFALQLCLSAQLPVEYGGLQGCTAYLCTEDAFPSKRIQQMKAAFVDKWRAMDAKANRNTFDKCVPSGDPCDHILVQHIGSIEEQNVCVNFQLPALLADASKRVKIVVIDSIAALFRSEFDMHESSQRTKSIIHLGLKLRSLCDKFGIAIICINQVSDNLSGQKWEASEQESIETISHSLVNAVSDPNMSESLTRIASATSYPSSSSSLSSPLSSSVSSSTPMSGVIPALGLVWSNFVTVRILLQKPIGLSALLASAAVGAPHSRSMHIVLAPHLPNFKCYFTIDNDGIKGAEL